MRRLRDPVRRTVRRLGWDVGARTRRLGARIRPGAGGRTDSQRRPKQQGNRDPVTLPRPRPADGAAVAPWAGVVRARRVGPHGQPRRWRTGHGAHRRQCRTSPTPSGYARRHRRGPPAVVGEHDHQVFSATLEPSRGSSARPSPPLRSASFHRSAAPGRGRLPGSWPAMSRTEPCRGTRAPHGDGTESPPWSTSSSGPGRGRRRASWPIWFGRWWCRRHNVSGSPSRHCKRARTGLAQRVAALERAQDVLAARERAAGRND
jgi:hypothetical protein